MFGQTLGNGTDVIPLPLAEVNRQAVLDALERFDEPCTINQLVVATTLSRPTVSAAVSALQELGIVSVTSSANASPRGGRPSRRFTIARESRLVAACAISHGEVTGQVVDLNGKVLAAATRALPDPLPTCEELLDIVSRFLGALITEARDSEGTISCISVAILGVVHNNTTLVNSHTFPMLHGTVLRDRLVDDFHVPVIVENDANSAALAEARERPRVKTMLSFIISDVVGCGIVFDGHVHHGAHGAAGELNSQLWLDLLKFMSQGMLEHGVLTYARAGSGDPVASAFVDEVARRVSRLMGNYVEFFDPDLIVIGGAAAAAGEVFSHSFRDELGKILGWVPNTVLSSLVDPTVLQGVTILGSELAYAMLLERPRTLAQSIAFSDPDAPALGDS